MSLPRSKTRRRRDLTADEVEQLAAEASRPPATRADSDVGDRYPSYGLAVFVLAYCRLRWSNLAALRTEHIDLLRRRSVPLPRFLADEIASQLAGRAPRDLAFTTVNGDVLATVTPDDLGSIEL